MTKKKCQNCHKIRKVTSKTRGTCDICYQRMLVLKHLDTLTENLKPLTKYNEYIFNLYIRYIKRYYLDFRYLKQEKEVAEHLEKNEILAMTNWSQFSENIKKTGDSKILALAFMKIGKALFEIGILPHKHKEMISSIDNYKKKIPLKNKSLIETYIQHLESQKKTAGTIVDYLYKITKFNSYLESFCEGVDLLEVSQKIMNDYITYLKELGHKSDTIRSHKILIGSFYKWCVYEKKIYINPCSQIVIRREEERINICSDDNIKKIEEYIRSNESNPEYSLILSLVLYYGFKVEDLIAATIRIELEKLVIIISSRSMKKDTYEGKNRPIEIELPCVPWFLSLQKRFINQWQIHYDKTKKSVNRKSLILPNNYISNMPVFHLTARERIKMATIEATGSYITPRLLRQTCGHLYSLKYDFSVLTRIGWSKNAASKFIWLPRIIQ